jgi:hypothetical protein
VRSVRPYFINWSQELAAPIWHCGGSPEALADIVKDNITDVNEFYQGSRFWRDANRPAPHNLFTSSENINKYLQEKDLTVSGFSSWQYKDDETLENRPATSSIMINYYPPGYQVVWQYDRDRNDYLRFLNGQFHKDEDGNLIRAKNVVIQYVPAQVIDEEKRLKMEVIGSGRSLVCLAGTCLAGFWQKDSQTARTRFYVKSPDNLPGPEFKFNAGTTWIEVVRPEIKVNY